MVKELVPDSAAARGRQLQINDLITNVNGRPVATPADFYREADRIAGPLVLTVDGTPARQVRID